MATQTTQFAQGEGNTKTPPARYRAWSITWNNYSEDELRWMTQFAQHSCNEYSINQEVAPTTKTPHLQIAVYLKNARTWEAMKKTFPTQHLEKAHSWNSLKKYCGKSDTRAEGTVAITNVCAVKDPLAGLVLRPFQKTVMDILAGPPDDRSIHWFWEPVGCTGKTALVKSICVNNSDAIFVNGKAADMKCAIAKMIEEKKAPKIVLLGLPRTCQDYTGSLYQGLEEIKDGIFFSGKYESSMVLYDSPHVMVFANWPPDESRLSADRWKIVEITQG